MRTFQQDIVIAALGDRDVPDVELEWLIAVQNGVS